MASLVRLDKLSPHIPTDNLMLTCVLFSIQSQMVKSLAKAIYQSPVYYIGYIRAGAHRGQSFVDCHSIQIGKGTHEKKQRKTKTM